MRTSERPGKKSMSMSSKVYCRIWCVFGSTHSVTIDTLFIFSSISSSSSLTFLSGFDPAVLEESGLGVVLDLQRVDVADLLAAGERVVALLERNFRKYADETNCGSRTCFSMSSVLVIGVPVSLSSELDGLDAGRPDRHLAAFALRRQTLRFALGVALLALLAILLAAQPLLLGLAAIGFRQLDAVGADRAAHEDAVADEPGVVAAHALEREAAGPGEVEALPSPRGRIAAASSSCRRGGPGPAP